MKTHFAGMNIFFIVFEAISIFVLVYTLLIKSIFASIDTLNENLANANVYNHLSTMIKQVVIAHIPDTQHAVLTNAIAVNVVNALVTPELIQQVSKPTLNIAVNWIAKPTTIENNNIVINTAQYKQQLQQFAEEKDLPQFLAPVGQELQKAIPNQIVIMDLNKHPHGIIPAIVRMKVFYQHINIINTVAIWTAIFSFIALMVINIRSIKRFLKTLAVGFATVSIVVLILSFLIPYVVIPLFPVTNVDQIIQNDFNLMIQDIASYLFAATRLPAIWLLIGSGALYFLYRWSYVESLQTNIDKAFFAKPTLSTVSKKKHATRHAPRVRHTAALHKG
jgi:hypothetical protein